MKAYMEYRENRKTAHCLGSWYLKYMNYRYEITVHSKVTSINDSQRSDIKIALKSAAFWFEREKEISGIVSEYLAPIYDLLYNLTGGREYNVMKNASILGRELLYSPSGKGNYVPKEDCEVYVQENSRI